MNQRDVIELAEIIGVEPGDYSTMTIMDALRDWVASLEAETDLVDSEAPEISALDMAQSMIAESGIMVRDHDGFEVDGVMKYYPKMRKATEADVLSANIREDQIFICMRDGSKTTLDMG